MSSRRCCETQWRWYNITIMTVLFLNFADRFLSPRNSPETSRSSPVRAKYLVSLWVLGSYWVSCIRYTSHPDWVQWASWLQIRNIYCFITNKCAWKLPLQHIGWYWPNEASYGQLFDSVLVTSLHHAWNTVQSMHTTLLCCFVGNKSSVQCVFAWRIQSYSPSLLQ